MSNQPWLQDLIQADWRQAVSNEMLGQHVLPQDPIFIHIYHKIQCFPVSHYVINLFDMYPLRRIHMGNDCVMFSAWE